MKFVIFVFTFLFLQFGQASETASGHSHGGCKDSGLARGSAAELQKELSLSDQQLEQVKAVQNEFAGLVESRTQKMKTLNEELITLLQTPEKGPRANAALLEKFKNYQAARNELYLTRFEMALKTRELLTVEQIKKYKAFYKADGGKSSK